MNKCMLFSLFFLSQTLLLTSGEGQLQLDLVGNHIPESTCLINPQTTISGAYDYYLPLSRTFTLQGYAQGELGFEPGTRQWLYAYSAELAFSGLYDSFRFMPGLQLAGEMAYAPAFTAPDFQYYCFNILFSVYPGRQEISLTPDLSWTDGTLSVRGSLSLDTQLSAGSTMTLELLAEKSVFIYTKNELYLNPGLKFSFFFENFSEIEASLEYIYADSDFSLLLGDEEIPSEILDYHALNLEVSASMFIRKLLLSLDSPAELRWKKHRALSGGVLLPENEWVLSLTPRLKADYILRDNFSWQLTGELEKAFSNSPAGESFTFSLAVGSLFLF